MQVELHLPIMPMEAVWLVLLGQGYPQQLELSIFSFSAPSLNRNVWSAYYVLGIDHPGSEGDKGNRA